ncbi:MAG: HlyD family secretion protein, partial [Mycobacteriaceae bacterium]|nr:HlyD family secretion protein [Mycobacteriaceae bacterium]
QIALDHALANLDVIKQNIEAGKSSINAAEAFVKKTSAEALTQQKQTERLLALKKQNLISQSEADQAETLLTSAQSNFKVSSSKLSEAKSQVGALDNTNAQLRLAQSAVDAAKRDLNNTKVYAPFDGQLQLFKIRKGQIISQNMPLFALIEDGNTWISANFKETELQRIKEGQSVKIKVDMYSGKTFVGKVESISRGSGSAFSLLPAENASGNWIKVTQRFPVKIRVLEYDEDNFPLRVGSSCKVTIDTTSKTEEKPATKKENPPSSATLSEKVVPEMAKEPEQPFWDEDFA